MALAVMEQSHGARASTKTPGILTHKFTTLVLSQIKHVVHRAVVAWYGASEKILP